MKIKAIHIITKLELGGAQENTLYTAEHLDRSTFGVVLITCSEGLLVKRALSLAHVKTHFVAELVREVNPIKDLIALIKIRKIIKSEAKGCNGHVLVHTHSAKGGVLGRWAAFLAGVKVRIHTVHGFSFHDYQNRLLRLLYILIEKITSKITTHYISVSEDAIQTGERLGILNRGKTSLIRSGIEINRFCSVNIDKAVKKRALGLDSNAPVVTSVTNFKPQKSPLDFARMSKIVAAEVPQSMFLLVGDGPLRPKLEKFIKANGLGGRLWLMGWRFDVAEIMAATDIFVLTSLWEGLPRVFLQAMAAQKPIVATDVGGAREVIKEGFNGYLAAPKEVAKLAEKVIFLLKNPQLAQQMGTNGSTLIGEFDIDKMVKDQEALYKELIGARTD